MKSIPFQFDTKYGQLSDALILSDEEFVTLTEADIEAMKQQRLANWINNIENPVIVEISEIPQE